MPTVLQKYNFLLSITHLLDQVSKELLKGLLPYLQAALDKLKANLECLTVLESQSTQDTHNKEKLQKDFDEQYRALRRQLFAAFTIKGRNTAEIIFDKLDAQLYEAIEKGDLVQVELLGKWPRLHETHSLHNTFLHHAINHNQVEIAKLLLKNGISTHLSFNEDTALYIAIKEKNFEMINLLFDYGATINFDELDYLAKAIETGSLGIVQMLVAKAKDAENIHIKNPINFEKWLSHAFDCKQVEIAQFLFDEIKQEPQLRQQALLTFLNNAPLELLKKFVKDPLLDNAIKFATRVNKIDDDNNATHDVSSGQILLERLLRGVGDPKECFALLECVLQQILTLKKSVPTLSHTEACYINREKLELEKLAKDREKDPVGCSAQKLLNSIYIAEAQERGPAGLRLLLDALANLNRDKIRRFFPGIKLTKTVAGTIRRFYEKNKQWPNEGEISSWIEQEAAKIQPFLLNNDVSPTDEETIKFWALAGRKSFSLFKSNLPMGGSPEEANRWLYKVLDVVVDAMDKADMLPKNKNPAEWKAEGHRLFTEMGTRLYNQKYSADEFNRLVQERIHTVKAGNGVGLSLYMPHHFVPTAFYDVYYTLMCRVYTQPLDEKEYSGAWSFKVPEEHVDQLLAWLIEKSFEKDDASYKKEGDARRREIMYRLLVHALDVEARTGVQCTYASFNQKPYQEPTCYISNYKVGLAWVIELLPKTDATPEQWQEFIDYLKQYAVKLAEKFGVLLEELLQAPKAPLKEMKPAQLATKVASAIVRWNALVEYIPPNTKIAIEGKKETEKHTIEYTRKVFAAKALTM